MISGITLEEGHYNNNTKNKFFHISNSAHYNHTFSVAILIAFTFFQTHIQNETIGNLNDSIETDFIRTPQTLES